MFVFYFIILVHFFSIYPTYYYYDNAGNITRTKEHDVVNGIPTATYVEKTYSYGDTNWKDKLTSYNGTNITYDELANPIGYRDGMSFTWENGRILKTVNVGSNEVNMKYDSNGMRIQKDDEDRTINYHYDSSGNLTGLNFSGTTVYFYYDSDGAATAMSLNGLKYYYIKNLQGDVVGISNQNGDIVVTYTYDLFGKIIDQTDTTVYNIANINPFCYRGYVYDKETGLYYLKSRYYDPETGRFINADIYCDTMSNIFGTNMFTYCNNNPVNQIDPEGTDAIWLQFTNALEIVKGTDISISLGFFDINIHTKPIQLGHTSLLVQDSINQWWYFYWGDKHMYLRPCGSSNFNNLSEINSYLSGFDPRPYHNYYVYAINVFSDNEDTGYYYNDTSKYHKIHDGLITGGLYFTGNYVDSYKYCYDEINDAIKKEGKNLNDCTFSYSEGDKTIEIIHLFNRNTNGEYLKLKHYNIAYRNCVQQTLSALKQAKSVKSNPVLYSLLTYEYTQLIPNQIYAELLSYAVFGKAGEYTLNQIRNITKEIWEVIA